MFVASCYHVECIFQYNNGKSPCDGVGGTVKHLVARASLQATTSDHILTPLDMYTWCKEHIPGIHFIFLEKAEVYKHRESLVDRFVPISLSHLAMFRLGRRS